MMNFLSRYRVDVAIFALALIARAFLFYVNFEAEERNLIATIRGDDGYYEISRNLSLGRGFTGEESPPYTPNPLRTPIYPGFIAGILFLTGSYWIVLILQLIIGALIPVLGRHVAISLVKSEKIGLLVGIALAVEPYAMLFSSIFYTETLFIFFFLLFILAFLSYMERGNMKTLALSSGILGVATLTKTTVQFLPILLVPILAWHFRKNFSISRLVIHSVLFLTTFLLVLSPWLYRNYRDFGVVGMSAQPAFNLFVYLVPSVRAMEQGTDFSTELKKFVHDRGFDENKITLANASFYKNEALAVLVQHPKGLALVTMTSFVTFFTHDGMLDVLRHAGFALDAYVVKPAITTLITSPVQLVRTAIQLIKTPLAAVLVMRVLWLAITIAFFAGVVAYMRKNKVQSQTIFALLLVLYFLVTTPINGLGVNARFRMPVNPIIITFAAYVFFRKEIEAQAHQL